MEQVGLVAAHVARRHFAVQIANSRPHFQDSVRLPVNPVGVRARAPCAACSVSSSSFDGRGADEDVHEGYAEPV